MESRRLILAMRLRCMLEDWQIQKHVFLGSCTGQRACRDLYFCAGCDQGIANRNVLDGNFVVKMWRENDYELCFRRIEFEKVAKHPSLEVVQAVVVVTTYQVGTESCIQLCVVSIEV